MLPVAALVLKRSHHLNPQESIMTLKPSTRRSSDPQANLVGDPVSDAITAALTTLLGNLRIAPPGPLSLEPARTHLFSLSPDPENLTIFNPLPLGGTLDVTLTVTWQILKRQNGQKVNVARGTLFDSQSGLNAFKPDFVFFPQLIEERNGAPAATAYIVRATVTLSVAHPLTAEPVTVGPFTLPDVEAALPNLLVPRLLALFRHRNFETSENNKPGFALLVLPTTSPDSMQEAERPEDIVERLRTLIALVQPILQRLNALTAALPSTVNRATALAGFLAGLQALTRALGKFPGFAVEIDNAIPNLNALTLIQRGFFQNDIEAENEISSLIAVGVGGSIEFFNKRDFDKARGAFRISFGSNCCAVIPNLHKASPVSTVGNATVRVLAPPKVALAENTFGNMISSVRFMP
jgi:hypothetical protein